VLVRKKKEKKKIPPRDIFTGPQIKEASLHLHRGTLRKGGRGQFLHWARPHKAKSWQTSYRPQLVIH
jgi:hypothetical protein